MIYSYMIENKSLIHESFKISDEHLKVITQCYKLLGEELTKAGYPASDKTWRCARITNEYLEDYPFSVIVYNELYLKGKSSDNNGLEKSDKESNIKFIKKVDELCNIISKNMK